MTDTSVSNRQEKTSILGLFLCLFWMFFGNLSLAVTALLIVQGGASFTLVDILYWVNVPLLATARYFDIARFHGSTAYGEPATIVHWRRYALGLLFFATAAWLACHGAAYALAR